MPRRDILAKTIPGCLLAFLALPGCDSEVVLDGNFEQWPNPVVSGPLPGDPAGDSITQVQVGLYAAAQVFSDRLHFGDAACPIGQPCASPARWAFLTAGPMDANQNSNGFTWLLEGEAYIQPGCDLFVSMFHGHFDDVAVLRFQRDGTADATVTLTHGDGSQVLKTLEMGEEFAFALRADPATSTFDMLGVAGANDLPAISTPGNDARGLFMTYLNPDATGCTVVFDTIQGYAED